MNIIIKLPNIYLLERESNLSYVVNSNRYKNIINEHIR